MLPEKHHLEKENLYGRLHICHYVSMLTDWNTGIIDCKWEKLAFKKTYSIPTVNMEFWTFGYLYSCNFSFRFDVKQIVDNVCANVALHIDFHNKAEHRPH
jgi:hypothetical protein